MIPKLVFFLSVDCWLLVVVVVVYPFLEINNKNRAECFIGLIVWIVSKISSSPTVATLASDGSSPSSHVFTFKIGTDNPKKKQPRLSVAILD